MPRNYVRTTNRGRITQDVFELALADIKAGARIREAARTHGIDRITLTRYKNKSKHVEVPTSSYSGTKNAHMVFSGQMEAELASHITSLCDSFYGLSKDKTLELAYEYAVRNEVVVPPSWINTKRAG